jgi:hypothetical protein
MRARLPHATVLYDRRWTAPERLVKRQSLQCNTQFTSPPIYELGTYEMELIKKEGYDVPRNIVLQFWMRHISTVGVFKKNHPLHNYVSCCAKLLPNEAKAANPKLKRATGENSHFHPFSAQVEKMPCTDFRCNQSHLVLFVNVSVWICFAKSQDS